MSLNPRAVANTIAAVIEFCAKYEKWMTLSAALLAGVVLGRVF